ncbi:MAG: thiamine pyrophosphate-binding protein [Ferroplasma sp.]|uniref:thiamine pyrophosphate-binding protein n=1 Tax=Ferroplasma sp. TaxID=2591003 RepID=UPI0028153DD2|nr:thiamine pyrophosphate-binding protein [Ferroplasma sp.]WMT51734.1 MAG: thiamine pyrophosphate-binding protein [Ferroplasma sp.]
MNGARSILEMLKKYHVDHVFGLIGETSFPLYYEWESFEGINHISGRDERNVAIMAEAYARVSSKPGVCEVPGVGASYTLPAIVEAYTSGTPLIELSSDISTDSMKKNVLTEYDKTFMFSGVTRKVLNVATPGDIPRMIRYGFRIATTPPSGPVFINFPLNVYKEGVSESELYSDDTFSRFPSIRQSCDDASIARAAKMVVEASRPVIICGQGVLYSGAWAPILELSEMLSIPVGTTISGKGSFPENHPLSIGVVGSRGGSEISRNEVDSADLIFFIGTNTDSASTSWWKSPNPSRHVQIIQLDSDVSQLGNNYKIAIGLLGDALEVLSRINILIRKIVQKRKYSNEILDARNIWESSFIGSVKYNSHVNPAKFIKYLMEYDEKFRIITADPGVGAIYTSAFYRCTKPGRKFLFNYSAGGLGFALPAAIGAYYAAGSTIVCLTSDGSMGFVQGELETVARYNIGVKVFIFNNRSFGWIRATMVSDYGRILSGIDFYDTKYSKIADAFSMKYIRIERDSDIEPGIKDAFSDSSPVIIEVMVLPEDKLLPPVPEWKHIADNARRL